MRELTVLHFRLLRVSYAPLYKEKKCCRRLNMFIFPTISVQLLCSTNVVWDIAVRVCSLLSALLLRQEFSAYQIILLHLPLSDKPECEPRAGKKTTTLLPVVSFCVFSFHNTELSPSFSFSKLVAGNPRCDVTFRPLSWTPARADRKPKAARELPSPATNSD